MTNSVYEGIDLASGLDNLGKCYLHDDGTTLSVTIDDLSSSAIKTAIDCPFGTTEGFEKLLHGEWPTEEPVDGFKSRKTELWLSGHIAEYETVQRWRARNREERAKHPGEPYFNGGGHIQPTLRMSIVPECLWYIANRFNRELPADLRRRNLVEARRGEGKWIEAHPRMFLYSIIERIYRAERSAVDLDMMYLAAKYKTQQDNCRILYRLIREQRSWMGHQMRMLQPADIPDELAMNNHRFDAFLCALTAC